MLIIGRDESLSFRLEDIPLNEEIVANFTKKSVTNLTRNGTDDLLAVERTFSSRLPPPTHIELIRASSDSYIPRSKGELTADTGVFREFLEAYLSDDDLTSLCYDSFRPVHRLFTEGMNKSKKTQLLLEHCDKHELFESLGEWMASHFPEKYAIFKQKLFVDRNVAN